MNVRWREKIIFKKEKMKNYRPLPDYLTVKDSPIEGLGLFATKDIKSGKIIGISHHYLWDIVVRTPLGGFINHSGDPNCELIRMWNSSIANLKTLKNIKSGDELTLKYITYDIGEGLTHENKGAH